jgi:hypothetical protein
MTYCAVCGRSWIGLPYDSRVLVELIIREILGSDILAGEFKMFLLKRVGLLVDFWTPDILL